ncbi:kinase-like domain-containing protein, partial [Pyrenochaeta sp. MPI-SDFR-AT-0127]
PPLPSIEEINKVLEIHRLTKMYGRRDVFRVGGVIVKSTVSWTILQEAEDLVFLNNNSQVRVPILYAAFSRSDNERPEDRRYYMVMEDIQGVELSTELWLSFGIETRKKICSKLAEQLRLLRETPPPAPAYYGRVHNQGWEPDLGLFRTRSQDLLGPYESYSDFCKAFLRTARFNAARCYRKLENDPVLLLLLSDLETNVELWNGNQPTFTHIDPAFGNMIIQQVRKSSDGDEDWEVALIDWTNAGWYPRWMQ